MKLKARNSEQTNKGHAKKEPMTDNVALSESRRKRNWKSMDDGSVIQHTKRFIESKGISSRTELRRADSGLCAELQRRKLMDATGLANRNANHKKWKQMGDADLVTFAQNFIDDEGIRSRWGIAKKSKGLYTVLLSRGLLDRLLLEVKKTESHGYSNMSDEDLLRFVKQLILENEIKNLNGLRTIDNPLYMQLWSRGLLENLGLKKKNRLWGSDGEVLAHAKKLIKEKSIVNISALRKMDGGLYSILWQRGLLGEVGIRNIKETFTDWKSIDDETLLAMAQQRIGLDGIRNKKELRMKEPKMSDTLWRRKLMDRLAFKETKRSLKSMCDSELIAEACRIIEEDGLSTVSAVRKRDESLYSEIYKRGLERLLPVKSRTSRERHRNKRRKWSIMSDEEIVGMAEGYIAETGIERRGELANADSGLYNVLRTRGLLDEVFSDVDSSKHAETVQGVLDALESFGDDP